MRNPFSSVKLTYFFRLTYQFKNVKILFSTSVLLNSAVLCLTWKYENGTGENNFHIQIWHPRTGLNDSKKYFRLNELHKFEYSHFAYISMFNLKLWEHYRVRQIYRNIIVFQNWIYLISCYNYCCRYISSLNTSILHFKFKLYK